MFQTEKIGLASYLVLRSFRLVDVKTRTRNRATFVFDMDPVVAVDVELDYTRSDFGKFFEAFKYLRDRTIRGSKGEG